tara:strand:- start:30470 stop:30688 length:219 start_codon:yes stop_codon:yes gene_type:complete
MTPAVLKNRRVNIGVPHLVAYVVLKRRRLVKARERTRPFSTIYLGSRYKEGRHPEIGRNRDAATLPLRDQVD